MWQEQLDYFWDGRRRLAIGAFDGADRAPLAARPVLTVVSAGDADFEAEATLADVIDAPRWRPGIVLFDVPAEHRFVRLSDPDGATLTLILGAERDLPAGAEYRLLMTLLPEGNGGEGAVFRVIPLPARGDVERLAREQTVSAGPRLVWAFGQRRAFEQGAEGALVAKLAPARRVFPAYQSRLLLEARPLETEAAADTREAPFAIMQHWVAENGAPRVGLRLRIPDSLEESATLVGRACVAMALNQRRRLRGWMQEQKQAGEPVIDPLGFEDIRQATGELAEHPDAVESRDAVVVANLLTLLLDPESSEADGVAVRRGTERNAAGLGETIDIDFYGASLGDEVGLVAPVARPGDLGVAPVDPGGPPFVRLFRVEADGLAPRRLSDDDLLIDELMRRAEGAGARAGASAAARAFAERAAGLKGRREKLVTGLNEALNRAGLPARFSSAGFWDVFEPLQQASFAALASAAAPTLIRAAGGYGAYAADPAVAALLARGGPLAQQAQDGRIGAETRGGLPFVARYAAACGAEGMAPPGLDAAAELSVLHALSQEEETLSLLAARIGLSPDPATRQRAAHAARALVDPGTVERALVHFEKSRDAQSGAALADYLAARRAGRWVTAASAPLLAALVARAGVEREEAETRVVAGMTAAAAPPPPPPPAAPEKPKGFFRRLFGG